MTDFVLEPEMCKIAYQDEATPLLTVLINIFDDKGGTEATFCGGTL